MEQFWYTMTQDWIDSSTCLTYDNQTERLSDLLHDITDAMVPGWNGIFDIEFKTSLKEINLILLEQIKESDCSALVSQNLTDLVEQSNTYLETAVINFTLPELAPPFDKATFMINNMSMNSSSDLLLSYRNKIDAANATMKFNGTHNKWGDFGKRVAIVNQVLIASNFDK